MRIVLEATRAEYVAWLRERPADWVFHYSARGNPVAQFIGEFVTDDGYDDEVWVETRPPHPKDGAIASVTAGDSTIVIEVNEYPAIVRHEIAIHLPWWANALLTHYLPESDSETSPAGAIADAEALPAETGV
jgi:hypothetical protein